MNQHINKIKHVSRKNKIKYIKKIYSTSFKNINKNSFNMNSVYGANVTIIYQ